MKKRAKTETGTDGCAATWSGLSKVLGVSVSKISKLRRTDKDAPAKKSVSLWREFLLTKELVAQENPAGMDYGKMKLLLLEARTGKEQAERKLKEMKIERESDDYVLASDAVGAINRVLEPLAKLLDGVPKAWSVRVNPNDPDHAEPVLREMVEDLKANLQAGRGEKITKRKGVK